MRVLQQHGAKRDALKKIISSQDASYEEKMDAATKLQKLPRDSSPSRQTTRCALTGRPRAVYSKFGLGRNALRKATMNARIGADGRAASEGAQTEIGGNDRYVALCRRHFAEALAGKLVLAKD